MSPLDKVRQLALRRPLPQLRTPSLTHTTPSPPSSSANSTPRSVVSGLPSDRSLSDAPDATTVPLPLSLNASPADHRGYPSPSERSETLPDESESGHTSAPAEESASGPSNEPTFSSEEAATPRSQPSLRSALADSPVPSPAPSSALFTPTPAFVPRPRARFSTIPATPRAPLDDDPTTPFARRRSFLMDVINSTARPRFAAPTPHPRRAALDTPGYLRATSEEPSLTHDSNLSNNNHASSPSAINETSDNDAHAEAADDSAPSGTSGITPAPTPGPLQSAFGGLTPAPRPRVRRPAGRLSIPFGRNWRESPPEDADAADSEADGFVERPSFASTASSHDLALHGRANASFDPAVGTGAHGGLGRFDAAKLNAYLHGLNRRLQEESEGLAGQVAVLRHETVELAEENALLAAEVEELRRAGRGRRSSGGSSRRLSDGVPTLRDVAEDAGGEGWAEEKAELEDALDLARADADRFEVELREAAALLEDERDERARDKERWRERMADVEKGVHDIIQGLEARLAAAQVQAAEARARAEDTEALHHDVKEKAARVAELERAVRGAEEERAFTERRADKAEHALAKGQELGTELRAANEQLAGALSDARAARAHADDLERALQRAEQRAEELGIQVQDERDRARRFEQELEAREGNLSSMAHHVTDREEALQALERELADARQDVADLETGGAAVRAELDTERARVATLGAAEEEALREAARLEEEAEREAELARQMEDALRAAEAQSTADAVALAELRRRVADLERDRSRLDLSRQVDGMLDEPAPDVAELEAELDDAYRKIGRLEATLAQSPARDALDKARSARLEMLEKERDELLERVQLATRGTPSKLASLTGISPMHRAVLNMTMRAPKTPGGPLADVCSPSSLHIEATTLTHATDVVAAHLDPGPQRLRVP
jgi:hypothetical protein